MSLAVMVVAIMVMLCDCHGCGRYGHPFWPIWFVADMVEPQINTVSKC